MQTNLIIVNDLYEIEVGKFSNTVELQIFMKTFISQGFSKFTNSYLDQARTVFARPTDSLSFSAYHRLFYFTFLDKHCLACII